MQRNMHKCTVNTTEDAIDYDLINGLNAYFGFVISIAKSEH